MRLAAMLFFLMAAGPVTLQVTDERGKKPGGVLVEASEPDGDDWYKLAITKSKGEMILVWPYDGRAKQPEGPEPVPVTVVSKGDTTRMLASRKVIAMLAVPLLLGTRTIGDVAASVGLDEATLGKAITGLSASDDGFEKGIGLLWAKKPVEAMDELALGLRARERVMTRIPSEIYPAAMLDGKAMFDSGKFENAAVVFLKAVKLRPSDPMARKMRAAALERAGKAEAAEEALRKR